MAEMEALQVEQQKNCQNKALLKAIQIVNFIVIIISGCSAPLLLRLYFLKGGNRKWLSSWLQNAGWPIILLPLAASYCFRRKTNPTPELNKTKPFLLTPLLFLASAGLGILNGLNTFLYAYGMSYLPVSTSSLLVSTNLAFTALFALMLVKQKFTACSINAVVLLSVAALLLGVNSNGDRPQEESRLQYYVGFAMTLGSSALYGLILPLVEMTYAKAEQAITYTLVLEMQMIMGLFGTIFCTVGMIVNRDFQVMAREASEFELGESGYYVLLIITAIVWQLLFLGTIGAIFFASALLAGVIQAALVPMTEVLGVFFFHESFTGSKGVALGLSLWGFASYFYGEYKNKSRKENCGGAGSKEVNICHPKEKLTA